MAKIEDISAQSLQFTQAETPSTPASGRTKIYAKPDGFLYSKDSDGTETLLSNSAAATGSLISGASEKTTPVDTDKMSLVDSEASNALKTLSWSNIKTTLATYFNALYTSALLKLTGYSKPSSTSAISTTDSINNAIGKLEYGLDLKPNKIVPSATGNIATIDAAGNFIDGGKKISEMQTKLTFDNNPTTSSTNPVTSSGIKTALDLKTDKTTTVNGHALSSNVVVSASDVGLGNVNNTSDANKPVSTAQQSALDAKVSTSSIVNDLTTGGTTVPLSAEQGKVLNTNMLVATDEIPSIPVPKDADTLGGQLPTYYATNTSISEFTANEYNLFDKTKIVSGKYIRGDTGVETALSTMGYVTIPVTAGAYCFINGDCSSVSGQHILVFFNASGEVVGNFSTISDHITNSAKNKSAVKVPSGATIMVFNFALTSVDGLKVYQLGVGANEDTKIADRRIDENFVRNTDTPFIKNLFDKSSAAILDYAYINSAGAFSNSSTFWCSPVLKVTEGEIYQLENWLSTQYTPPSLPSRGIYLDNNFCFVSTLPTPNSYTPQYTIPSGVSYATFLFDATLISSFSIKRIYSPSDKYQIRISSIYPALPTTFVNGWSGKKWVSFGDSITYREAWQPSVINTFNLIHTNCGIGSTALAGTGSNAFWQDVRLNAVKAADPDMVTILGGANDLVDVNITIGTSAEFAKALAEKDKNTFIGAYSYIIETLLTWKPTLRIVILGTTWAHMNGADYSATLTYTDYSDASKLVAQHYGLPFVDLHGESAFNQFTVEDSPYNIYSNDHIHPNALGAKRIAELVISKLQAINPII